MEMTDHVDPVAPSTFAPSFSAVGVTLEAIMAQLQRMDARLDSLTNEMCQVNTCVGRIARRQGCLGGFTPFPSPSLEASVDEDGDDEDVNSFNDDVMTTSQ